MVLSTGMHRDFAVILLVLGLVAPLLSYRRVRRLLREESIGSMDRLALYASTIAFQWLAVAAIMWRTTAHGIRPEQLGLAIPKPALTVTIAVVLSLVALLNQIVSIHRLASRPAEIKGTLPQLAMKIFPQSDVERLVFLALVITVALCEEVIYRGFVQRVFQDVSGGMIAAGVVLSAVFFAMAHIYQGRRGCIATFVVGVLFAAIRTWTGSIAAPACAHFVADLSVGLLAPKRLRAAVQAAEQQNQVKAAPSSTT